MLDIPEDKLLQAARIVERIKEELINSEPEYVGFNAEFEYEGLWIHDDGESIDVEHVAILAQALLDELEIDEPFIFSWAYTCSKPRIDEFGGGACAVRRGKDPIWCDARNEVEEQLEKEKDVGPIEEAAVADDGMGDPLYKSEIDALHDITAYHLDLSRNNGSAAGRLWSLAAAATLKRIAAFVDKHYDLLWKMEEALDDEFDADQWPVGSTVTWTDPDEGKCNRTGVLAAFKRINEDTVRIKMADGWEAEVQDTELKKL